MEHLCIGSYARIMTSCAASSERKYDSFCEKLLLSLCDEDASSFSYITSKGETVTYDYTNFNKLLGGQQNLPTEISDMAKNKDAHTIERYFVQRVIPSLDEARKKNAVLALKYVILHDDYIDESTQLGTLASLTKEELKSKNQFVLSEFLTDVFLYTVAKTDNLLEVGFTKSVKKNFYSAYDGAKNTIVLYEPTKPRASSVLPITSKGRNFDKVFTPVSTGIMNNASARQDLQIFCLKFEDKEFDYHSLWKHLRNNIGYYVHSRTQIQEYIDNDEIAAISYDAVEQIKKSSTAGTLTGDELGEILLYIFLEQVLNAPKFMSRVELDSYGGFNVSNSAGIHILTSQSPLPYNQIVFGTSKIEGDLRSAIDDAFSKAAALKKNRKKERRFVESRIFAESFSKELSKTLESIILPSGGDKNKPDSAYGMFIGYSLEPLRNLDLSPEDYQKETIARVKADIDGSLSYIDAEIDKFGLHGYSFYIYILPFADADTDKKEIFDRLLQVGGDSF